MKAISIIMFVAAIGLGSLKSSAFAASYSFDNGMRPIVENYLKIQHALSQDSVAGIPEAAKAIESAANKFDTSRLTGMEANHFSKLPMQVGKSAHDLIGVTTVEKAREIFKALSAPLVMWAKMTKPAGIHAVSCSMAKAGWLQKEAEVHNPYYGKSMESCGEVEL